MLTYIKEVEVEDGFRNQAKQEGQIPVPVVIQRRLGVKGGDQLWFVLNRGMFLLRPARTEENPFTKFIGALNPHGQPDGTAVNWVREMRDKCRD